MAHRSRHLWIMTRRGIASVAYILLLILFILVLGSEYRRVRAAKQQHGKASNLIETAPAAASRSHGAALA